jgi:dihydropteroate synthase
MAVVNVTPDSFSDGGRHDAPDAAIAAGRRAWRDGAWIVDVGGESTRPGAEPVDPAEEIRRVAPVVEALAATQEGLVSVDTRRAEVARVALDAGAHLVNDVGGLRDPAMRAACADAGVPAVAMHMRGEPRTMQDAPAYDDVVAEVEAFLREARDVALADGVPDVVLDPGWGFGKRDADNLALFAALPRFAALGAPVLMGWCGCTTCRAPGRRWRSPPRSTPPAGRRAGRGA